MNLVFLLLVFLITVYYVFHGQNFNDLLANIKSSDVRYWFLAVICVLFFIEGESVVIYYMMRSIKQKIKFGHCLLYSFVGFFFSCITPSASGGQPAQIYYMKKDNIPISVATLVLMIVTITYKTVLIVLGAVVLLMRPPEIMNYLQPVLGWCYIGIALNVVAVSLILLLAFHPTMAKSMLTSIIMALSKIHLIKRSNHYINGLNKAMKQYQDVALYFGTHRLVVWNVFVITVVQRLLLFFVTYLICLSFGINAAGVLTIIVLQGMISVAVDMLPLPGGMGISEKLFLSIFTPICGSITLPVMVVSRGIGFYTQLIISALLTIVAHFVIAGKREREKF